MLTLFIICECKSQTVTITHTWPKDPEHITDSGEYHFICRLTVANDRMDKIRSFFSFVGRTTFVCFIRFLCSTERKHTYTRMHKYAPPRKRINHLNLKIIWSKRILIKKVRRRNFTNIRIRWTSCQRRPVFNHQISRQLFNWTVTGNEAVQVDNFKPELL